MKISAIVPVYNSEKYIKRCVDSVIAQTYTDWELILVDDGSTDNSLSIMREYEEKDSRIITIHQHNKGPGLARNAGISKATGEYIVFVDSDDRINKNYFYRLSKKKEDVVFIDINQVDEDFHVLKKEYMSSFKSLSKDSFLRQQMTGRINWGGCRKAVKRDLLLTHKIEFSAHKIGEESIYSFLILWNANSFSFIDGSLYDYVNRSGSQSDYKMDDPWGDVATTLKKKITEIGLYSRFANTINAFEITATIVSLDRMALKYHYGIYSKLAKDRLIKLSKDIDDKYSIDYSNMNSKAIFLYPLIKMKLTTVIFVISRFRRMFRK